ncbi:MAG TPA: PVC-type heme-binding CxxCH protein, partial [Chthoniobacteraceae bacterium]
LDGTGAGILVRGDDVWWTCIPHLWHFHDTSGDGKADVKNKLLSGFGVKFALRGHDMHGLRFGPDGKLYFSIGDRGINVTSKEGKKFESPDTGSIMRCNPDGTEFEVFATGVRNPQELAFNEYGDLFTGDNNSDGGDKGRFVHLVEGGDCGWRMSFQYINDRGPWNREKLWDEKEAPKARYLIPPIANIASGPSGLTYNPGTALSDKYKGHFFLSDFRGGPSASVVHDISLEANGAWYKVKERHDLVQGILTTDCEFGPDGSLYVLDWVEGWSGANKGRIYKFTAEGANRTLQAETQKLIAEGMSQRGDEELGKLLGHADTRVRQAAQFALADKGPASAATLAKAAQSGPNQLGRLHGIWGLGQLAQKNANAMSPLLPLLADGDAEVRAQAAKVLGDRRIGQAADKLIELLKDQNSRVRFFAALSLGKLGEKKAVDALFTMLAENNDQDPILRHGGVMGLTGCATAQQLAAKASDGSAAVKFGAIVALRRQQSAEVKTFLNDSNEDVVLEAARAIHDVPISDAMPALAALATKKEVRNPHTLFRAVNANYRLGKSDNARALAAVAGDSSMLEPVRRDALEALANWGNPEARDRILNLWRPLPTRPADDAIGAATATLPGLLKDSPGTIQEMAAKLAAKLSIKTAGEPLFQLASNGQAPGIARVAALKALADLKDPRLAEAAKAAVKGQDQKLRTEGLQVLATQDPGAAVKVIGEIIHGGSPTEKQGALLALTQIKRPEANALLTELMDKLVAGSAPAEIQLDIYEAAKKSDTPELKDRVGKFRDARKTGDPINEYKISLAGGDVERGRKIFREKAEVQCLRCHKAEIGDSVVGPDLTKIGAKKDRLYLLESIVFPNKHIAEGFQTVVLTLADGNIAAGRVLSENAQGL